MILIAEDSPTQAEMLAFLLTDAGHEVLRAGDGAQALALAREHQPTLVITDVVMPRMDGYALCRAIKSDAELRDTPVLLLTSLADPADVIEGLACGADNFIRKPYDEDYLLARVEQVLAGRRPVVSAEPQQLLDFLFSAFEETVRLGGELSRSTRALDGLSRIAEGLNRCTTEQEVAAEALRRALELPGAQAGWILIDGGNGALRVVGASPFTVAAVDDCECFRALHSGWLERATNVLACACLDGGTHASVPLRSGARVVGALNLVGPDDGAFDDSALRMLDGVGNQVGAALERALLQEHLERRVEARTAELTAAQEALRTAAAIVECSDDAIVRLTPDGRIETWNPGAARMYGYAADEVVGRSVDLLVPVDRLPEARRMLGRVAAGESVQGYETVRLPQGGEPIDVSLTLSPVRDGAGAVVGVAEIARDITLARRLERQLVRSQKLDSLGRLAGGIAHEFNNLMTAVIGFSELALPRLAADDPVHTYIEEIRRAGERAASLTRRLLAFDGRRVLRPAVVDLNAIVTEMDALLERLIGPDIDYAAILAPDLWRVKVDPAQIEQVVMNLALNARDAMPEGGKLTIETANAQLDADYARRHLGVASGAYVAVTVSDTGSEPGHGTTFRVYLPRTTETADLAAADGRGGRPAAGSQTVLLVEDEAGVRRLVRMILEQSGRTVIDTGDAHEALDLARRHPGAIDLLITDIVMPGLSGRDVAARVRAHSPDTRVLYMSGYTGDAMIHRGLLRPGAVFLVKPFTAEELLDKVRTILERPAREEA